MADLRRKRDKMKALGFRLISKAESDVRNEDDGETRSPNKAISNEDSPLWCDNDFADDNFGLSVNVEETAEEEEPDELMFGKEILKMKHLLELEDTDETNFDPLTSHLEDKTEKFLFNYLKLVNTDRVTYSHMDKVLKLLKETLLPTITTSHETIIKRFAKKHLDYDYYITCDCGELLFVRKSERSREFTCPGCRKQKIQFDQFVKEHDQTCVFSMRDQIKTISTRTNRIRDLPDSPDDPLTLNLLFTLDGCPLSKSSKQDLYPMILYIDNFQSQFQMEKFPIHKTLTLFTRDSAKNNYRQVIAPLLDELREIGEEGFETNWSKRTAIKIKLIIADSKVRAMLMNFLPHNGRFPCHRCEIELQPNSLFPLPVSNQLKLRRTSDIPVYIEALRKQQAAARNKTQRNLLTNYRGVKGPSLLAELNLDLVNVVILDIMHLVFLGVCRLMVTQFCEDAFKSVPVGPPPRSGQAQKFKRVTNPYYLNKECKEVLDNRLSEIKTPSSISRPFRSLVDLANFKAKEFENFLFFSSYFALLDVLEEPYFGHLMLLNSAIHKLYSKMATPEDVEKAKFELDLFLACFEKLNFSDAFFKYNCHSLLHLYEDRKYFNEPLSRYNAYGYESELQFDKACCKSKNKTVEEIARKISLRSLFQVYAEDAEEVIFEKDQIYLNKNTVPVRTIIKLLNITTSAGLKFYQKAQIRNKAIRVRASKKVADSYVKIDHQFFQVTLIFQHDGVNMVLCEKIPISRPVSCKFETYTFTLDHIKIIDMNRLAEKESFVFRLDQIVSHCLYVRIDDVLKEVFKEERFIVDLEV